MKTRLIILMALISAELSAQDPRFSQYLENPMLLNPALAGATHRIRASLSYRNQWRTVTNPFKTMGASLDMALGRGKRHRTGKFGYSGKQDVTHWAFGLSVYKDKAGAAQLSTTSMNLALAYRLNTGERSFFSAALQGGFVQKNFDQTAYVFPNQYDGLGYSASVPSNENLATPKGSYFDAGGGVLWIYDQDSKTFDTHREFKFVIGGAAHHVLQPSVEYLQDGNTNVGMRYTGHFSMLFSLKSQKYSLAPSGMFQMQGPHKDMIGGVMLRYYFHNSSNYTGFEKRTTVGLGAYYRNGDAIVAKLLFEMQEQYAICFSYDFNYSALNAVTSYRGGYELTLRYSPPHSFLYAKR